MILYKNKSFGSNKRKKQTKFSFSYCKTLITSNNAIYIIKNQSYKRADYNAIIIEILWES